MSCLIIRIRLFNQLTEIFLTAAAAQKKTMQNFHLHATVGSNPCLKVVISRQQTGLSHASLDVQFREAYNMYAKRLFNTALRIVGRTEDAEDILQESFLEAFRNLQRFEGRASMGSWLHRIVVNRSVNLLKSRRLILVETTPEMAETAEAADEISDLTLQVEQIRAALTELPAGYRTVLTLYLYEGFDHEEIASILGIAPVSVRSQYHRARHALLKIIRQQPSI
jgi:RNA polymerase sigma factor (sigma-70 family)